MCVQGVTVFSDTSTCSYRRNQLTAQDTVLRGCSPVLEDTITFAVKFKEIGRRDRCSCRRTVYTVCFPPPELCKGGEQLNSRSQEATTQDTQQQGNPGWGTELRAHILAPTPTRAKHTRLAQFSGHAVDCVFCKLCELDMLSAKEWGATPFIVHNAAGQRATGGGISGA